MGDTPLSVYFKNPRHHAYLFLVDTVNTDIIDDPSISVTTFQTLTIENARRISQIGIQNTDKESLRKLAFLCESITIPAQHALLKICEEPGSDIVFYFIVRKFSPILDTLKSRCVIREYSNRVSENRAEEYIKGTPKERMEITDAIWNKKSDDDGERSPSDIRKSEVHLFLNDIESFVKQHDISEYVNILRSVYDIRLKMKKPTMTRHTLHLLAFA